MGTDTEDVMHDWPLSEPKIISGQKRVTLNLLEPLPNAVSDDNFHDTVILKNPATSRKMLCQKKIYILMNSPF